MACEADPCNLCSQTICPDVEIIKLSSTRLFQLNHYIVFHIYFNSTLVH